MNFSASINCYILKNLHGLIFDSDSIRFLRLEHRIVGCFTGSIADQPRQNNELGIPLELSIEECFLLATENRISLVEIILPLEQNDQEDIDYLNELDRSFNEQKIQNGHERINEILVRRDEILKNIDRSSTINQFVVSPFVQSLLETNNAWINSSRSLEDDDKNLLLSLIEQRLKQFTVEHMHIKVQRESSRKTLKFHSISIDEYSQKLSSIDRLKSDVFLDLYRKHYWISNGHKFGGDFLVYSDDPSRCHSSFIVNCVSRDESDSSSSIMIPLRHLIARCRVAVNVRKKSVLATRTSSNIEYLTMNWAGF